MGKSNFFIGGILMENLMVKPVDVLGRQVMAVKDEKGNIFAGVSYFCNALGMSRGQKNRQVANIQKDETLKRGCIKLGAGVLDEGNEAVALRIDFIPIWLAKVSITDRTKHENPELADKLLEYQLKAKDILAAAFLPKQSMPRTSMELLELHYQALKEVNKKVGNVSDEVQEVKKDLEQFKQDMPVLGIEESKITSAVRKAGVKILGGKESNAYNDKSLRSKLYSDIYRELKRQFDVTTYKAIKRSQCSMALSVIETYKPPIALEEQIQSCNAQMQFGTGVA